MSKHASYALKGKGYVLPEDSRTRLQNLRDHMAFLSRLAEPRTWDEAQDAEPEVPMGELAVCLALLAEQADLVLDSVSWPGHRANAVNAFADDAAAEEEEAELQDGDDDEDDDGAHVEAMADAYTFGATPEQIDTLKRLVDAITAQGDVLSASDMADDAKHTPSQMGRGVLDAGLALRAVLAVVEAQRLGEGPPVQHVGEARACYRMPVDAGLRLH